MGPPSELLLGGQREWVSGGLGRRSQEVEAAQDEDWVHRKGQQVINRW